jgi:thiopurine S-methyltransferase
MEHGFWQQRWEKREIGFHEGVPNALLVKHFADLALPAGATVFLPLCGKTRDIHWLLSRGFRVVGAELSEIAVEQLFSELQVEPVKSAAGPLTRYSADSIAILQGDIFGVTADALGRVDLIYDRAALVALPQDMRTRYAAHIADVTRTAPQFLITFVYDQSKMDGPPFSVGSAEVRRLYESVYDLVLLERTDVAGGLKGKYAATEEVWHLRRKAARG